MSACASPQLQYQCGRMCGYAVTLNGAVPLARCLAGRRRVDVDDLLSVPCGAVTTAVLRPGDRLRLQDVVADELPPRYVLVAATPAQTAASNFWGVVKLAGLRR